MVNIILYLLWYFILAMVIAWGILVLAIWVLAIVEVRRQIKEDEDEGV